MTVLLPSTTHAAPLCNRSLPVCVVRDNVTVNYADACSDGTYVDDPPSCAWNSTNQSLVIAANVTVRCDRPSNSGCDKASDPGCKGSCRLAFDFAHGITVESGARVSAGTSTSRYLGVGEG